MHSIIASTYYAERQIHKLYLYNTPVSQDSGLSLNHFSYPGGELRLEEIQLNRGLWEQIFSGRGLMHWDSL